MKNMLFMKSTNGNSLIYRIDCETALSLWERYYDKVYVYNLLKGTENAARRVALETYYKKLVKHKNTARVPPVPMGVDHRVISCAVCNFEAGDIEHLKDWIAAVSAAAQDAGIEDITDFSQVQKAVRNKAVSVNGAKSPHHSIRYICPYEESARVATKTVRTQELSVALLELIAARYGTPANERAVASIKKNLDNESLAKQIAISEALIGGTLDAEPDTPITSLYLNALRSIGSPGHSSCWAAERQAWACIDYMHHDWYVYLTSLLGQKLPENIGSVMRLPD